MQNALDALDQGNEPKIGVDFSGNCCGLYEEGRVNKMFMTMPKYGLPKGASRKGIAPLHVAVGASTKANTAATKRMLATAVEGVQKVFGETGKCLQHTLMLSYFLSFRQTSIQ